MKRPAVTREKLAAAGTLVLIVSGCVLTVGSSLAVRSDALEELSERREVLSRLVRGAASAGASGQARIAGAPPTAFIEAPTQGQAGAQLQSYFSRLALAQQATIAASGVEAPTQEAPEVIRIHANLEIAPDALQALIYGLETGTPYLTVDALAVQPSAAAARSSAADPPLRVNLMLRGQWRRELPPQTSEPGAAEPAYGLSNPLAAQALEDLSATRDQPLFAPTRRPPAPPPAPSPPVPVAAAPVQHTAPPEPPAVILHGVVMEAGRVRAMVRGPANENLRVEIGDKIGEWTVAQLDRRHMVLTLNDRSEMYALFSKGPVRPTRSAPPAPQQRRPAQGRRQGPAEEPEL